jgi:hypothetical protein
LVLAVAMLTTEEIVGDWFYDLAVCNKLKADFNQAKPFPHVLIGGFFSPEVARELEHQHIERLSQFHVYNNPIEKKHLNADKDTWTALQRDAFRFLHSPPC